MVNVTVMSAITFSFISSVWMERGATWGYVQMSYVELCWDPHERQPAPNPAHHSANDNDNYNDNDNDLLAGLGPLFDWVGPLSRGCRIWVSPDWRSIGMGSRARC